MSIWGRAGGGLTGGEDRAKPAAGLAVMMTNGVLSWSRSFSQRASGGRAGVVENRQTQRFYVSYTLEKLFVYLFAVWLGKINRAKKPSWTWVLAEPEQ